MVDAQAATAIEPGAHDDATDCSWLTFVDAVDARFSSRAAALTGYDTDDAYDAWLNGSTAAAYFASIKGHTA